MIQVFMANRILKKFVLHVLFLDFRVPTTLNTLKTVILHVKITRHNISVFYVGGNNFSINDMRFFSSANLATGSEDSTDLFDI